MFQPSCLASSLQVECYNSSLEGLPFLDYKRLELSGDDFVRWCSDSHMPFPLAEDLWQNKQLAHIHYVRRLGINASDGFNFRARMSSPRVKPSLAAGSVTAAIVIPEFPELVGDVSRIVLTGHAVAYKTLGGRNFCTDNEVHWIHGTTSKLGVELSLKVYVGTKTVPVKIPFDQGVTTLHMALAMLTDIDYHSIVTRFVSEFAAHIALGSVLDWKNDVNTQHVIDDLTPWLKNRLRFEDYTI